MNLEQNEAHQKKCVDRYEQMPGNAWISRIIMKKNAPPKCNKVKNYEIHYDFHYVTTFL